MERFFDQNGLTFTASNAESVAIFYDITKAYVGMRTETRDLLKSLLQVDPEMPMVQCLKGYFAKLLGNSVMSKRAKTISDKLNEKLKVNPVSPREALHAQALTYWCQGELDKTADIWEKILIGFPLDLLAIRLAHFNHFYSGNGLKIRDSIARVLPEWPKQDPEYGYLLGMYAFGLEESGKYELAERYGREAVSRNSQDAWGVHAVTHVMEMREQHQEGADWIESQELGWNSVNNFRFHLHWHQCLFYLELGEYDKVLNIYDEHLISDLESEYYLDFCNAASILYRLQLYGLNVGDRWQRLARIAQFHTQDQDLVFVSLHYLIALVKAGDHKGEEQMMDTIVKWAKQSDTQGRVTGQVGQAVAEAICLINRQAFQPACEKIKAVRYNLNQIGGSEAQRDLFKMMMLNAAKQTEDTRLARSLFTERVAVKPASKWSRLNYEEVLAVLGEQNALNHSAHKTPNAIF